MGFFPVTISVGLYCWRIPAFSWWAWKMLSLKLGCLLSTSFSEYSRVVSRALHIREGEKMRLVVVKWWCLWAMTEKRVFKSCSQRPTALVIELKTHKTASQEDKRSADSRVGSNWLRGAQAGVDTSCDLCLRSFSHRKGATVILWLIRIWQWLPWRLRQ